MFGHVVALHRERHRRRALRLTVALYDLNTTPHREYQLSSSTIIIIKMSKCIIIVALARGSNNATQDNVESK